MREYMKKPQAEIVTLRLRQLFDYYGRDSVLNVVSGLQSNREIERHLSNLMNTYFDAYFEVIEMIYMKRKVG